jgi:hypothetical protein
VDQEALGEVAASMGLAAVRVEGPIRADQADDGRTVVAEVAGGQPYLRAVLVEWEAVERC